MAEEPLFPDLGPSVDEWLATQQSVIGPETRQAVGSLRREKLQEALDGMTDDVKMYGPAGATAINAFEFYATGDLFKSGLAGGLRDAAQEVIDGLGEFHRLTGNVQEKLLTSVGVPESFAKALSGDIELPEIESETQVGAAVRPIVSFIAGFMPLNRAAKAAGIASNLTRDVLASAGAGALTVPHELMTLADLASEVPGLGEVVPDFLKSDPGDSVAEAKLKQAANEALGVGIFSTLVRPFMAGMKWVRGATKMRQTAGVPGSAHAPTPPTAKERLNSWWLNNLVSGLSTQALNMGTNLANTVLVPAERLVATTIAHGPRAGLYEARATMWGFMQGLEDAFRLSKSLDKAGTVQRAFVTGKGITDPKFTKLDPGSRLLDPPDLRTVFQGGPMGVLGNVLDTLITSGGTVVGGSRGLITGDEAFKTLLHRVELHRLAAKEALDFGYQGADFAKHVANRAALPTPEMMESALNVARYGTFTQALGPKGEALMNFRNEIPLMKFFFPFVRTPTNIFKFSLERTPLAPAMKHVREELRSADPFVRTLAMTRITYGTALMALGAKWAADGVISGGGPVDPELRRLSGKPPYSIRVGDEWIGYNRYQPWGMLLGMAADLYAISGQVRQKDFDEVHSAILAAMYRNSLDAPFTQGFADLADGIQNGFREGNPGVVLRRVGDTVSTLVTPRFVSQFGRAEDPVMRSARTMLDQLKNQVPGYRSDLPYQHDALGDEVLLNEGYGEGWLGVFTRFAIPTTVHRDETRNRDVRDFLSENEIDVGMPRREVQGVPIDELTFQGMVKRQGELALPMVRLLMVDPSTGQLTRAQKEMAVKAIFAEAREAAAGEVLTANPELQRRAVLYGAGLAERREVSMQRNPLSLELPQ